MDRQQIRPVEVADILRARDERAARQNAFLDCYASSLISFTMNIAGNVKYDSKIHRAFSEGVKRIDRQLERMELVPLDFVQTVAFTGCEGLWAVCADPNQLKARMCAVEEADALGRLFDIDVIDAKGVHLTRSVERRCLICGGSARACARSRAHSSDVIFRRTHEIIDHFFQEKLVRRIGELAQRALLYEAITTPKPGLVDCENSGAHRDMDLFSFAASACALRSYFEECVRIGLDGADFERLQYAGLRAEDEMLAATGANTHKGAIFSLGILCCAVGSCAEGAHLEEILAMAAELGKRSLDQMMTAGQTKTGGERQFIQYGLTGARGEAASGFKTVREIALPVLEKAMDCGKQINDAGLETLVALMARVQDSNVIRRAGVEGQKWVTEQAQDLMEQGFSRTNLSAMNERFVEKNVSPGGSADLLAAALFLYFVKNEKWMQ